jgi:cold shock CspA family protein
MVGEVVRISDRGFGFIQAVVGDDIQTEQYFHASSVEGRILLRKGDIVHFVVLPSTRRPGLTEAMSVRLLRRGDTTVATVPEVQS